MAVCIGAIIAGQQIDSLPAFGKNVQRLLCSEGEARNLPVVATPPLLFVALLEPIPAILR